MKLLLTLLQTYSVALLQLTHWLTRTVDHIADERKR